MMGTHRWAAASRSESVGGWLSGRLVVAQCVFAAGLLTELAAPIGLFGAAAMVVIGLGLIGLHAANAVALSLPLPELQLILFTFFVLPPLVS